MNKLFRPFNMAKVSTYWDNVKNSLWFVPGLLVLGAIVLAYALGYVDRVYIDAIYRFFPDVIQSTPEGAAGLLAAIAGSLITVVSVAFSITIVAIQQASNQYSPRVLRTFTSNRSNQIVLGTYIATFTYTLLVLGTIRYPVDGREGFTPIFSVIIALILALICLGLLVYFIHSIALSLQVSSIIKRIHSDLLKEIDTMFPKKVGIAVEDTSEKEVLKLLKQNKHNLEVESTETGFVREIDERALSLVDVKELDWVRIHPAIGNFVSYGETIITMHFKHPAEDEELVEAIKRSIVYAAQPSIQEDAMFGIRQLSDIAVKALSPGINDPTTAEYCIFYLGDILSRLAEREFPERKRTFADKPTAFIFNRPSWEQFVDLSFSQIRSNAEQNIHVTGMLLESLEKIARCVPKGSRKEAIRTQLHEIRINIRRQSFSSYDRKKLITLIEEIDDVLKEK